MIFQPGSGGSGGLSVVAKGMVAGGKAGDTTHVSAEKPPVVVFFCTTGTSSTTNISGFWFADSGGITRIYDKNTNSYSELDVNGSQIRITNSEDFNNATYYLALG